MPEATFYNCYSRIFGALYAIRGYLKSAKLKLQNLINTIARKKTKAMQITINPGLSRSKCFIFERNGQIYRSINAVYAQNFDLLQNSGLLDLLQTSGQLVHTKSYALKVPRASGAYRVIKPVMLRHILSYEYSFSMKTLLY